MKASVIIPSYNAGGTLPAALRSIEDAAKGLDVEIVVVDDESGRGPSWARNRGLDKAGGDVVFFVDADDTVDREFFSAPLAELERSGAEMCFFDANIAPMKTDCFLRGHRQIRASLLPAFFGFSFDDVRRWNQGGALFSRRELGYVWRVAFRMDFLKRHALRFDERMFVSEDAAFLSECVFHAESVTSVRKKLYNYSPGGNGLMATAKFSRKAWDYKIAVLDFRKRLVSLAPEEIARHCEASHVFSMLEMLRIWRRAGVTFREFWAGLDSYLSEMCVRDALRKFPLSHRHPLTACAVMFLRALSVCKNDARYSRFFDKIAE